MCECMLCFSVGESECGCVDSSSFRFIPSHLTSKTVNVRRRKEVPGGELHILCCMSLLGVSLSPWYYR